MIDDQRELFDRLYRDHQPKVYRLALSFAGNSQDAEDITQEAFCRAFRSYDTFRGESSFFTWIYRIALNVAHDHVKYRTKLPIQTFTEDEGYSYEDVIDSNPASNPETELLARQVRIKCLHALTECLQAKERQVFCLAITLDLPHKEIADILECSTGSVKTTLHRAKKRWLGFMENRCQFIDERNPCNCRQWVRFALARGVISKDIFVDPLPPVNLRAKGEVTSLWMLRAFYEGLHQERAADVFVERVRNGIRRKEWQLLS